jgi:hypothetical protein
MLIRSSCFPQFLSLTLHITGSGPSACGMKQNAHPGVGWVLVGFYGTNIKLVVASFSFWPEGASGGGGGSSGFGPGVVVRTKLERAVRSKLEYWLAAISFKASALERCNLSAPLEMKLRLGPARHAPAVSSSKALNLRGSGGQRPPGLLPRYIFDPSGKPIVPLSSPDF